MRFGILPTYRSAVVADPDYAAGFARLAEEGGCDSIWTVEHVIIPADYSSRYPYAADGRMPLDGDHPVPDPLEWLSFVAAVTDRVKLATGMLILPEHNPLILAKRLSTLDVLSRGRLLIGVGVGWLREEADALGVPFDRRGARTDEYIAVLRTLWQNDPASFDGSFARFRGVKSLPKPAQPGGIPIVIGGHSRAAARRAGRLGDGFYPLGVGPDELGLLLGLMRREAEAAGRDPERIELTASGTMDLEVARRFVDLGVARFTISARGDGDLESVKRLIGEFADRVVSRLQ